MIASRIETCYTNQLTERFEPKRNAILKVSIPLIQHRREQVNEVITMSIHARPQSPQTMIIPQETRKHYEI